MKKPGNSSRRKVVVLSLGRERGVGDLRRRDSWVTLFETAGHDVTKVGLLAEHHSGVGPSRWPELGPVLRGAAVPETLAWSPRSLSRFLDEVQPALIVSVTGRAFSRSLTTRGVPVILDLMDEFSVNYRSRAALVDKQALRTGFSILARTAAVFERRSWPQNVRVTAAGRADADALGAEWVPNVLELGPVVDPAKATHDVLFFGTLSYPPNVAAIDRLSRVWPSVQARRPETTALIAGRFPSRRVLEQIAMHDWSFIENFPDHAELCQRGRVAIALLESANGIQNKVLEAAAHGLPQVITSPPLAGLDPAFPLTPTDTDDAIADRVVELLEDPQLRETEGMAARRAIADRYTPDAWVGWAAEALGH